MIGQQRWIPTKLFKLFFSFFILTSVLLSVSAYKYFMLKDFMENSVLTWGEVIAITQKNNGEEGMVHFLTEINNAEYKSLVNYYDSGKYLFYPTIEFFDQQGNKHSFISSQGFPSNLLGSMTKVQVRYDSSNPHIAMIDTLRNYHSIWTWIALASFPGTITLVILLGLIWQSWRYGPM